MNKLKKQGINKRKYLEITFLYVTLQADKKIVKEI